MTRENCWKIEKGKDKEFYIVWWYGFHGSPSSKWVPEAGKYINVRNSWTEDDIEEIKKLEVHESHVISGPAGISKVEIMRII